MGQIIGVGGVFVRASDPEALYKWYEEHLGLVRKDGCFQFPPDAGPGLLVLMFFRREDSYFPPEQPVMLNLRVADMEATLTALEKAGAVIDPKRDAYDFGKFAWFTDPEGNRVELWQPTD